MKKQKVVETTLLDLVWNLQIKLGEDNEDLVTPLVTRMIRTGQVKLTGNFKGMEERF